LGSSVNDSFAPHDQPTEDVELADIHELYQDLFLTDIRQEVEQAQSELKQCKTEQNNAQIDYAKLKKDNINLNATLNRYRRTL
jgi:hypothetical protein